MDLFEINKRDFLTCTDKLSGLILGEKLKNKSADKTCRVVDALFLRMRHPSKLVMDNGWNFTSKKFTSLEKYGVEHTKCSPHHHQGNGIAKKSVDTLKRVMQKVPTPTVEEACFKLNSRIRPGAKASPLSCFFGRKTRGDLPNMFNKVCHIMETVERHIKNQFEIAQRREHLSWDVFKVGDRV